MVALIICKKIWLIYIFIQKHVGSCGRVSSAIISERSMGIFLWSPCMRPMLRKMFTTRSAIFIAQIFMLECRKFEKDIRKNKKWKGWRTSLSAPAVFYCFRDIGCEKSIRRSFLKYLLAYIMRYQNQSKYYFDANTCNNSLSLQTLQHHLQIFMNSYFQRFQATKSLWKRNE